MPSVREHPIRILYSAPGTRPPVYVAASFTSPPWQPIELDHESVSAASDKTDDETELTFFKDFYVPEGHWNYKFRLGPGDWWVCNENVKTETDDAGNCNNVLIVPPWLTPGPYEQKRAHIRPRLATGLGNASDVAWQATAVAPEQDQPTAEARAKADDESSEPVADDTKSDTASLRNEPSPLFAHECLTPEQDEANVYFRDQEQMEETVEDGPEVVEDAVSEMFPTDREHILQRIQTTKMLYDEDETLSEGISSPSEDLSGAVTRCPLSPKVISPQLESIGEEDSSDEATPAFLELTGAAPSLDGGQALSSNEKAEPASRRSSISSHHSIVSAPSLLEHSDHTVARHFGPTELDGSFDLIVTGFTTPKLMEKQSSLPLPPVLNRRQSLPGSFDDLEEDSAVAGDGERGQNALREHSTAATQIATATARKYTDLFRAFWNIVFVSWFGAILARLPGKGGQRK